MILCLDAGNTRAKWGLHDGVRWLRQQAVGYEDLPALAASVPRPVAHLLVCNVAGPSVQEKVEHLARQLAIPLTFFKSSAACCGVQNSYDQPARLGADRWAGLIAGRALLMAADADKTRSPEVASAIVVQAGTATTIDYLDAAGVFQGGLILPGMSLMQQALTKNTAGLKVDAASRADLALHVPPKNTQDAIMGGALHATLGAIERMRALQGAAQCIVSGGAAAYLLPHLASPVWHVDYLVLEGLLQMAKESGLLA
jgi:type III pantothenate kinase